MKRTTSQYKQKLALIAWLGLVVFALHVSVFFLNSDHTMLATPCAGMSNALCPILQFDLMNTELLITRSTKAEIPNYINAVFYSAYIVATIFFAIVMFLCAWHHIRKRNYLYGLFYWQRELFSQGILHSRVYA